MPHTLLRATLALAAIALSGCPNSVIDLSCSVEQGASACARGVCIGGVCVEVPDAAEPQDAGAPGADAGAPGPDASQRPDGGKPDASLTPDASHPDASVDGGPSSPDAGPADAGNPNHPPTVTGTSLTVHVRPGDYAVLVVSATDPEGDRILVSWTQDSGATVNLIGGNSPVAGFTAPSVIADGHLLFHADVCDDRGACAAPYPADVLVDLPPSAATLRATPSVVAPGGTFTLTAGATDPLDTLSYTFSQVAGPTTPIPAGGGPSVTLTAPVPPGDASMSFEVSICDSFPSCVTAPVEVVVRDSTAQSGSYVSTTYGNDFSGTGTQAAPWKTITKGVSYAAAQGLPQVFVDVGTYPEAVTMLQGVSVWCGYDKSQGWVRRTDVPSIIQGSNSASVLFAGTVAARLDGCTVRPPTASPGTTPLSLVAVSGTSQAVLADCDIDCTLGAARQGATTALSVFDSAHAWVIRGSVGGGSGANSTAITQLGGALDVIGATVNAGTGATLAVGISVTSGTLNLAYSKVLGSALTAVNSGSSVGVRVTGGSLNVLKSEIRGGAGATATGLEIGASVTSSTISQSLVSGGTAVTQSVGIACASGCTVVGNEMIEGGISASPVGLKLSSQGQTVNVRQNKTIAGGTGYSSGTSLTATTTAILVQSGSPAIAGNNSILGGAATSDESTAVRVLAGAGATLDQNWIIAGSFDASAGLPGSSVGLAVAGPGQRVTVSNNGAIIAGPASETATGIWLLNGASLKIDTTNVAGGSAPKVFALRDGTDTATGGSVLEADSCSFVGAWDSSTPTVPATKAVGLMLTESTASLSNLLVLGGPALVSVGLSGTAINPTISGCYFGGSGSASSMGVEVSGVDNGTWRGNIFDGGPPAPGRWPFYESGAFKSEDFLANEVVPGNAPAGPLYHTSLGTDVSDITVINTWDKFTRNVALPPVFVDPAAGDFHLQRTSPLLGAGPSRSEGASDHDMDLQPRPASGNTDIGPDEIP